MKKVVTLSIIALIFAGISINYWVNKKLEFTPLEVAESYNNEFFFFFFDIWSGNIRNEKDFLPW